MHHGNMVSESNSIGELTNSLVQAMNNLERLKARERYLQRKKFEIMDDIAVLANEQQKAQVAVSHCVDALGKRVAQEWR